jgi:hypothetical protein
LPFAAVKSEKKDNKWYLTVDETKDSLKTAAGYKYDSSTTTWSPDGKSLIFQNLDRRTTLPTPARLVQIGVFINRKLRARQTDEHGVQHQTGRLLDG